MTTKVVLTARVEKTELSDGSTVYVGSIAELPGVYTQAEAEETALADLVALVKDAQQRLGSDVVGLNTPAVAGWKWTLQAGQAAALMGTLTARTYGSVETPEFLNPSYTMNRDFASA